MKNIKLILIGILMSFILAGCAKNELKVNDNNIIDTDEDLKEAKEIIERYNKIYTNLKNLSSDESEHYKRGEFTKVADNLYEVEYYDYNIDYALDGPSIVDLEKILATIFNAGCTSVRKDNYYGRNLDFTYGNLAEVIVRVKAKEGRYGNIGVTGGFSYMTPDSIDNKYLDIVSQAALPLLICDGINEKGVVCNVNVVPAADLEKRTTGTNPEGHSLNMYTVPRFILDNAATAKEAIDLLKEQNIYTPWDACNLNPKGMEFHFMIADKDNTYVVEFINNKMEVIDLTNEKPRIMTNFYLYYKDNKTPHSSGVERYKKVEEQYDDINTIDDMKRVMESVKFSKCYGDEEGNDVWYSDDGLEAKDGTHVNFENYEAYIEELKPLAINHRNALNEAVATKNNPGAYWITMHTSVFDIENKTMEIAIQERYDEGYYKFAIE